MIVIGLDGATFDVIGPLVEQGKLPHLGRLMAEGNHGPLQSIIPPVTAPAWSVLATGKDPGQLGVFDFLNRHDLDSFTLYPVRSADIAGQTFWDILGTTGKSVGILGYPMLVPAYPVNGWMVAGVGASRLHDFVHPRDLKEELDRVTGGYEITISYRVPKYKGNLPLLVENMRQLVDKRIVALDHLLATRPVDVLVVVFAMSDVASHALWKYWETNSQTATPDPSFQALREGYTSVWQALDRAVGHVLQHLAPGGNALILSDHGFGPSHGVFHINEWLQHAGYLVRQVSATRWTNRMRDWLFHTTRPLLHSVYRKMLGSAAHQFLRASVLREIDLIDSRALALENSDGCGAIYVNREYARARGLDEDDFVRNTSLQLRDDLLAWGQANNLQMQVYLGRELYSGDKICLAPEIMLVVENHRCSVSYRLDQPIYADRPHHPMKSGTHRMDGILIATGPKIRRGRLQGARLHDIAPTLLHLAGAAIPKSIDGRVLTELLRAEFRPSSAPIEPSPEPSPARPIQLGLEDEDEDIEIVLKRLSGLGYLD